jgi:hypothetical protein
MAAYCHTPMCRPAWTPDRPPCRPPAGHRGKWKAYEFPSFVGGGDAGVTLWVIVGQFLSKIEFDKILIYNKIKSLGVALWVTVLFLSSCWVEDSCPQGTRIPGRKSEFHLGFASNLPYPDLWRRGSVTPRGSHVLTDKGHVSEH